MGARRGRSTSTTRPRRGRCGSCIALAIWRIVLPYLVLLRFPLLIAIAISIGAGYTETIDSTFALSRTLGMLPFFVFGWKLRQWQLTGRWLDLPSRVAWRWRAGAIALFVAVLVVMPIAIETWRDLKLRRFMLYDESYVGDRIRRAVVRRHPARAAALRDAALGGVPRAHAAPRDLVHAVRHGDDVHLPAAHLRAVPVPRDRDARAATSRSGCCPR